jgi:hypothetical protein
MVAIRKRNAEVPAVSLDASPPVTAGAGVAMDAPSLPSPVPDTKEALQKRLAELEAAEAKAAQLRQQQAEIRAQMVREQKQPEAPKLSQRDLEFIGARPGIERDVRMAHMANGLEAAGIAYGTERFYQMMEAAFPLSDYRRTEPANGNATPEPQPTPQPAPQPHRQRFAKPETDIDALMLADSRRTGAEPRREYNGGIHSAPPSRESFSPSTGRPTAGRVVLSADERALARSCGVSDQEWAMGKVKLEQRRKAGLLQEDER